MNIWCSTILRSSGMDPKVPERQNHIYNMYVLYDIVWDCSSSSEFLAATDGITGLIKTTSASGDRVVFSKLIEARKVLIIMDNTWSTLCVVVCVKLCAEMQGNHKGCVWFPAACQFVITPIRCYKSSKMGWATHWHDDKLTYSGKFSVPFVQRSLCGW